MARGQTAKLYRTFIKGLITEAGFLTYPEDASTDELNTVIKRKGNRSRRFGIQYEPDSTAAAVEVTPASSVVSEYHWKAVDDNAAQNFLVVQIGSTVYFFDTTVEPVTSGFKSFTIDLLTHKSDVATDANVQETRCQMAAGKGFLFIVSQYIEPLIVEYDPDTDTISVVEIAIQIRDFDGVDDGLANDEEPTTLSPEHYYNLRNQGWVLPGSKGVFGGTATDPNTPPSPPATDSPSYYDPWQGGRKSYEPYEVSEE